jgi:hypothetical protein
MSLSRRRSRMVEISESGSEGGQAGNRLTYPTSRA